jgi:hypothetical protein
MNFLSLDLSELLMISNDAWGGAAPFLALSGQVVDDRERRPGVGPPLSLLCPDELLMNADDGLGS